MNRINGELAQLLLLEQAIMLLEADLCWMDMIEARLDDTARQTLPKPEILQNAISSLTIQ